MTDKPTNIQIVARDVDKYNELVQSIIDGFDESELSYHEIFGISEHIKAIYMADLIEKSSDE